MKKYFAILGLCFLAAACSVLPVKDDKIEDDYYKNNMERFMQNISIKAETPRYVTYEYKDVRIDEVASLAARYCNDHGGKKAFLRENITFRNHLRRATFDCVNLQ